MACNLPKLIRDLKKIAVDGMVEGIPLDVAVIRLTGAYTAQMNSKFDSDKSIQDKLKKIKELMSEEEEADEQTNVKKSGSKPIVTVSKRVLTKGKAQLDPAIIEQAENCK